MAYSPHFPYELPQKLESCLRGLSHVVYVPNPGNLGDELIAVATVQLFERLGVSFEIYEEGHSYESGYTLVYGGGGVMMPDWGCIPTLRKLFTDPALGRCVVLSHSMRACPELLEVMDERFTVFLREQQSLDYARALNHSAIFLPADDMVFYLNPRTLPDEEKLLAAMPRPGCLRALLARMRRADKNTDHTLLLARFYRKTYPRLRQRLPQCVQMLPDGRRLAWFLRQDREQLAQLGTLHPSLDLSRLGGSMCRWPEFNLLGVSQFLKAIESVDVVVTDRLHVSIASAMLGKELLMLDNSYGKLLGVYERSMHQLPGVHFCRSVEELHATLNQIYKP